MILRTHITKDRSLQLFRKTPKDQEQYSIKPVGFWYAIGSSWIDWCRSEMPRWMSPYLYTFDLAPEINLLVLDTPQSVRDFTNRYGSSPWKEIPHWKAIDWSMVCRDYDGLEFNPYLYSLRMENLWYSGIDVPSGVIFNTDMVVNLKRNYTKTYLRTSFSR